MIGIEAWKRPEQGEDTRERIDIKTWPNGQGFYMEFCISDGAVTPKQGDKWTRMAYGIHRSREVFATNDFVDGRILPSRVPRVVELSGFFKNAIGQIENQELKARFRQMTANNLPILKSNELLKEGANALINLDK